MSFWIFRIDSANFNYRIWIRGYTGNATDSFSDHNGSEFSTYDNINDQAPKCCPCAKAYGGGWWFHRYIEYTTTSKLVYFLVHNLFVKISQLINTWCSNCFAFFEIDIVRSINNFVTN